MSEDFLVSQLASDRSSYIPIALVQTEDSHYTSEHFSELLRALQKYRCTPIPYILLTLEHSLSMHKVSGLLKLNFWHGTFD